jgi:putative flippase GtrA
MKNNKPVALIPAYKPDPAVIDVVCDLVRSEIFQAVVVVNDGSGQASDVIFRELQGIARLELLTHYVNLGKGAALKTGFNHIACNYPDSIGIVTLDADGQHLVEDVLKVAAKLMDDPNKLILGSREFQRGIPLRSRFGNLITCAVMRFVAGIRLSDTQTGLRGIPGVLIASLLRLKTMGYDFELDMLLDAKYQHLDIIEVPIHTVYIDGNRSSHFNPFVDSLKIYLVFLRFNLSSLLSVVIDYSIFSVVFVMAGNVLMSQFVARFCAGMVNYFVNRSFVFKSDRKHKSAMATYFTTLVFMGVVSYGLIQLLNASLGINIYISKFLSEGLLFIASFSLQREFVFTRKENT